MNRFCITCFAVIVSWLASSAPAAEPEKLTFDTYSGYFVSNKFEPNAADSFVAIADKGQFDKVFGAAFVMNDKSHRLAKDAFTANIVLGAIKRGNAVVQYKVEGVSVKDGIVELTYSATDAKPGNATFASPLIVSIPKGDYKTIEFVENGKSIKKIDMGK